ncbi:hypothetical protein H311_01821 [Anncaliia algerae PRA109]|nr:hypothetical protein H311_02973 [Anncaliia algerae PRA109]KCZ77171.1 hypothetical protein H311_01821 [Anncaliia algerae PRA109]
MVEIIFNFIMFYHMRILEYNPNESEIRRRAEVLIPLKEYPAPMREEALPFKQKEEVAVVKETNTSIYVTPLIFDDPIISYTSVRIFNLPLSILKQELEQNLITWSKVNYSSLSFITVKGDVSKFRGFVFVNFKNKEDAIQFIRDVDGRVWDNYKIGAQIVKE